MAEGPQLERANGRLVTAEIVGNEFAGPPLGVLLFGLAVALPFASSSVSLLVAVVLVVGQWGIRAPFLLGVPALALGALVAARRLSPETPNE